jgi:hypothetical protein
MGLSMPGAKGKIIDGSASPVVTLPASTRARTYAGAAALKAYCYPKGVSGNPSGMNRYYFECRKLAKEASPEIMRELIRLGLTAEDERVKSVACVAVLYRAGVKPIDHDPAEDQVKPTWDPGALSDEEREQLKAIYRKMLAGTGRP